MATNTWAMFLRNTNAAVPSFTVTLAPDRSVLLQQPALRWTARGAKCLQLAADLTLIHSVSSVRTRRTHTLDFRFVGSSST